MSPTSYQAAPPRIVTIAEASGDVKFERFAGVDRRGVLPSRVSDKL